MTQRSNARPGFGVQFLVGQGDSPETFVELAEVIDVPGLGHTVVTDEVTHMGSPNGVAEYIKVGVKEGKSFTLPMNFVADYAAQKAFFDSLITEAGDGRHNYRIKFTDVSGTYITFEAIASDTTINHAQRAKADCAVTFQPSGPWSWGVTTP